MYRKIFRAISPKKDYRNVSSKTPPVFAFEAWLATLPVCQVLQQFGPCAEPFQPAVHDFRVRGYQGISGTGKSGLCKPPGTGLVETFWMETAKLKCGVRQCSTGKKKCLGEPTRGMNSSENQGIRNSSFGMTVLGLFRWVATAFKAVSLATSIFAELPVTWNRFLESGFRMVRNLPRSWFFSRAFFFLHLQCDGLKLDKFFEEKNPSQFGAWFLSWWVNLDWERYLGKECTDTSSWLRSPSTGLTLEKQMIVSKLGHKFHWFGPYLLDFRPPCRAFRCLEKASALFGAF